MAECLKLQKDYPHGCAVFSEISPNVELDERGIREDKGTAGLDDHRYTQVGMGTCFLYMCVFMCNEVCVLLYMCVFMCNEVCVLLD